MLNVRVQSRNSIFDLRRDETHRVLNTLSDFVGLLLIGKVCYVGIETEYPIFYYCITMSAKSDFLSAIICAKR